MITEQQIRLFPNRKNWDIKEQKMKNEFIKVDKGLVSLLGFFLVALPFFSPYRLFLFNQ
jgi:hypothetical protein